MVKVKLLQITWHAKEGRKNEPILGIDFHPTLPFLATAGADCEIKIWKLIESPSFGAQPAASTTTTPGNNTNTVDPTVEYLYTLVGHNKSVNSVRWSPNGESLASVSDGKYNIIFR